MLGHRSLTMIIQIKNQAFDPKYHQNTGELNLRPYPHQEEKL